MRSCRLAIRSVLLRKSLSLADAVSGGTSMTREAGHTCHCAWATVRTARCARPRHILHGSTRIVTARHGRTKDVFHHLDACLITAKGCFLFLLSDFFAYSATNAYALIGHLMFMPLASALNKMLLHGITSSAFLLQKWSAGKKSSATLRLLEPRLC